MTIKLDLEPCAKPRMTQSDKWKKRKCVVKYFSFKDKLNYEANKVGYKPTVPLSIVFVITMPKSWSKRKKDQMDGKPHKSRPDLDNLIKAFKDALLEEDSHVWQYGKMEKRWGHLGNIQIIK